MKLNFILIDDSSIELFLHQKSIEQEVKDAEVLAFLRARKALDYLGDLDETANPENAFVPHVILVDLNMPEMDGIGFLNAFWQLNNKGLRNTRVYVLSSSSSHNEIEEARNHHVCSGFIPKPLTTESIQQITYAQYADPFRTRDPYSFKY